MCCLRLDVLKWNGWGYKDSGFVLNERNEAIFQGKRYAGQYIIYPLHYEPITLNSLSCS